MPRGKAEQAEVIIPKLREVEVDAAPDLIPAELLAMQRRDAAPNLGPTELLAMQGR